MEIKEALPVGTILDSGKRKYTIKSVLGQGGFGITYLATSTIYVDNIPFETLFAIKEHYISSMNERQGSSVSVSNANNTEEIKESIDSFLVEAQRLNRLSLNHSGLVRVNESFRANGTAYYVMEYIKGQSLREYVRCSSLGRLPEAEALQLFRPVAEAIDYLHENKITHLDIKPDNILIRENGEPVVIDFGLSKHYNSKGTPTSTIKAAGCSAGYSPMEQYVGITTFTPEADIYALGATLLYMLTGKDPMISTEITEDVIANSLTNKAKPSTVSSIIHSMTKLKENRTHDVKEFYADIRHELANESSQTENKRHRNVTIRYREERDILPSVADSYEGNNKTKKKKLDSHSIDMESDNSSTLSPIKAFKFAFKRIFDFNERSTRPEFFWTIPVLGLLWLFFTIVINNIPFEIHSIFGYGNVVGELIWNILFTWLSLFVVYVMSGICIRRLHDAGYSGWLALFPMSLFLYLTSCFLLGSAIWWESFSLMIIILLLLGSIVVLIRCFHKSVQDTVIRNTPSINLMIGIFLIVAILLTISGGMRINSQIQAKKLEDNHHYAEYKEYVRGCQNYLELYNKAKNNTERLDDLVIAHDNFRNVIVMEQSYSKNSPDLYNESGKLKSSFPSNLSEITATYINHAKTGNIKDYPRVIGSLQLEKEFSPSDAIDALYESVVKEGGNIKITKIEFANTDKSGEVIDEYGSTLYAKNIRFLTARVSFDWFEDYQGEVNVNIKIISPYGKMDSSDSSPKGFTLSGYIRGYNQCVLTGWGNDTESTYERGTWKYEIWHKDRKIYAANVFLK